MESKTLYDNEWVSLMQTPDGYVYSHQTRCNGQMVAVIVFTRNWLVPDTIDQVLGRYERNPAHDDDIALTSITGGVDKGLTVEEAAVMELMEEGGFDADAADLIPLGAVRQAKDSDATVYLFAFDATDVLDTQKQAVGDGTQGEEDAYWQWIAVDEAVASKCPLASTMLMRLLKVEGVSL